MIRRRASGLTVERISQRRPGDVVLGSVYTARRSLISPSRQRFGRSARYTQLRVSVLGETSVRPILYEPTTPFAPRIGSSSLPQFPPLPGRTLSERPLPDLQPRH